MAAFDSLRGRMVACRGFSADCRVENPASELSGTTKQRSDASGGPHRRGTGAGQDPANSRGGGHARRRGRSPLRPRGAEDGAADRRPRRRHGQDPQHRARPGSRGRGRARRHRRVASALPRARRHLVRPGRHGHRLRHAAAPRPLHDRSQPLARPRHAARHRRRATAAEGVTMPDSELLGVFALTWQALVMLGIGGLLIYLGIARDVEPVLLVPIGMGIILANIPLGGLTDAGGLLAVLKKAGIDTELFPLLIFIGVGAMIDFGSLLERPYTVLLGAAAQFGIFGTFFLAYVLGEGGLHLFDFTFKDAVSIGIIGSADGPTSIYVATVLGT